MKKLTFFTLFLALATLFVGCGKDDGGNDGVNNPPTAERLVGSWVMTGEDYSIHLVFNENTWTENNGTQERSGTYALDGDILTMKMGDSLVNQAKVIMLYGYNVLVLRFQSPYGEDWGLTHEFGLYYRKNATIAATQADIQGKWFWYMRGDNHAIRCALEFKGNAFDFIIPVWCERMKGTYEYVNGKVSFHVTEFLVREYLEEGNEAVENLYSNWAAPEEGSGREAPSFGINFEKPFVANGNEAYCVFANLPAYFEKQ